VVVSVSFFMVGSMGEVRDGWRLPSSTAGNRG
jgi:hypothetical protein